VIRHRVFTSVRYSPQRCVTRSTGSNPLQNTAALLDGRLVNRNNASPELLALRHIMEIRNRELKFNQQHRRCAQVNEFGVQIVPGRGMDIAST
jgi:hypothetical protein